MYVDNCDPLLEDVPDVEGHRAKPTSKSPYFALYTESMVFGGMPKPILFDTTIVNVNTVILACKTFE